MSHLHYDDASNNLDLITFKITSQGFLSFIFI